MFPHASSSLLISKPFEVASAKFTKIRSFGGRQQCLWWLVKILHFKGKNDFYHENLNLLISILRSSCLKPGLLVCYLNSVRQQDNLLSSTDSSVQFCIEYPDLLKIDDSIRIKLSCCFITRLGKPPLPPCLCIVAPNSSCLIILMRLCMKRVVRKIFEVDVLKRPPSATLHQIFCKIICNFISKQTAFARGTL